MPLAGEATLGAVAGTGASREGQACRGKVVLLGRDGGREGKGEFSVGREADKVSDGREYGSGLAAGREVAAGRWLEAGRGLEAGRVLAAEKEPENTVN